MKIEDVNFWRRGAKDVHQSHKLKAVGSSPTPAPNSSPFNFAGFVVCPAISSASNVMPLPVSFVVGGHRFLIYES